MLSKRETIVVALFGLMAVSAPLLFAFQRTDSGDPITPTVSVSPKALWGQIGSATDTITAANATPAVGARDYSAFWTDLPDANKIAWDVPNEAHDAEFRFRTTANADGHVVEIWIAPAATTRGGSEECFQLAAILTLTGGQQAGNDSDYFVDTIVAVDYTLDGVVYDSAADRIASWRVDLRSFKKVILIATTLNAKSTLACDVRYY